MQYNITDNIFIEVDESDIKILETVLAPKCTWVYNKKTQYITGICIWNGVKRRLYLTRILTNTVDSDLEVDHKDRNRLNYKQDNLRQATSSQQKFNQARFKNSGVSYHSKQKKWQAYIGGSRKGSASRGTYIHLGVFNTEGEARNARREAIAKHAGGFLPV